MSNMEQLFDINNVLKNSYEKLEQIRAEKNIELIFEMNKTIPRKLRGNYVELEKLLINILTFVFTHTTKQETLLCLSAPSNFLYEECISFKINNTEIPKENFLAFLEMTINKEFNHLNAKIINDDSYDLYIEVPFIVGELGFRRHYRLPSKSMLNKRVLLIVESENVTFSIMKMIKYFPYDVDIGYKEFKENKIDFYKYDVVIIEDRLITESFVDVVKNNQEKNNTKYALLGNEKDIKHNHASLFFNKLEKPITQESIFELIVSLFSNGQKSEENTDRRKEKREPLISCDKLDNFSHTNSSKDNKLRGMIEQKRAEATVVLDTQLGIKNARKMNLVYSHELENFLETFYQTDLYFREVVQEKAENKIKEFCKDLEQQSNIIGAECMLKFAETVNLLFVYNKPDMLPIYPGRYHLELTKLVSAIKKYLHIK